MQLHIIYDDRRPEKWEPLMVELSRQAIHDYTIWEPVPAKTVVQSINLSFKRIVQFAKDHGMPEVAIAEDDLMFTCEGAWKYFLANKPKSFDIYIAGNYLLNDPDSYTSPHYAVDEYVGNQLIIVSQRYYDTFLGMPDNAHIDTVQKGWGDFYACFPMAALQRPGYSANTQQVVNYNHSLKKEWLYNGTVHNFQRH